MILAGRNDPDDYCILIGLSEANITQLKAGYVIERPFSDFGVHLPGWVGICYGKTELDIEAAIREAGNMAENATVNIDPHREQQCTAMTNHPRILIGTVGLPRSGKSTWAKAQTYPVVCPDAIRLSLHGQRFAAQAEPYVWAIARTMVSALFHSGHQIVILDATNVTRKRREEWQSSEWATFWHAFDTSAQLCRDRARQDGYLDLVPVIDRMEVQLEPLDSSERRW